MNHEEEARKPYTIAQSWDLSDLIVRRVPPYGEGKGITIKKEPKIIEKSPFLIPIEIRYLILGF